MIPLWVEPYLRVPFVSKGRDWNGCDCFGLVRLVLSMERGVVVKEYGFISAGDKTSISDAIREAEAGGDWIPFPIADARPFDVAPMTSFVETSGQVEEAHVGVFVTPEIILHTEFHSGPVCVHVKNREVLIRLRDAWRHKLLWE